MGLTQLRTLISRSIKPIILGSAQDAAHDIIKSAPYITGGRVALSAPGAQVQIVSDSVVTDPNPVVSFTIDGLLETAWFCSKWFLDKATDVNNEFGELRLWAYRADEKMGESDGLFLGGFTLTAGNQALTTGSRLLTGSLGSRKWVDTIVPSATGSRVPYKVYGDTADAAAELWLDACGRSWIYGEWLQNTSGVNLGGKWWNV